MPLPKIGTQAWEHEVEFYLGAKPSELVRRSQQLGILPMSYRRMMIERGVSKRGQSSKSPEISYSQPSEEVKPVINLPPIILREFKPTQTVDSEEIAVLHMSDGHAGKITKTFNEEVYKQRMDNVFDSTMDIVSKHRKMYKINKLWIPNTGDNLQGENVFQGSKVGSIQHGSRDQAIKVAFPAWVKLIASLKQEFEEVIFDGIVGNHGHNKFDPETSTDDLRLYDLLQVYFATTKGVTIKIHEPEYSEANNVITMLGFRFFVFHGDGIKISQGVPFFALDKRLKNLYMQYHGFNYALGGHFHKRHIDELSSACTYIMCSSLVSDDEFSMKTLGISSTPSQNIFGLHHRRGITWNYALCVDDEFIPEKIVRSVRS
jgi:hypothetical protein